MRAAMLLALTLSAGAAGGEEPGLLRGRRDGSLKTEGRALALFRTS